MNLTTDSESPKRYEALRRHSLHYAQVLESADELVRSGHEQVEAGVALYELNSTNIKSGHAWAERRADKDTAAAGLCILYAYGPAILFLRLHSDECRNRSAGN